MRKAGYGGKGPRRDAGGAGKRGPSEPNWLVPIGIVLILVGIGLTIAGCAMNDSPTTVVGMVLIVIGLCLVMSPDDWAKMVQAIKDILRRFLW